MIIILHWLWASNYYLASFRIEPDCRISFIYRYDPQPDYPRQERFVPLEGVWRLPTTIRQSEACLCAARFEGAVPPIWSQVLQDWTRRLRSRLAIQGCRQQFGSQAKDQVALGVPPQEEAKGTPRSLHHHLNISFFPHELQVSQFLWCTTTLVWKECLLWWLSSILTYIVWLFTKAVWNQRSTYWQLF